MNAWIPDLLQLADAWGQNIWRATWQGAVVLAAAWAIARWCTFLSPRVVCWVWRLACLKLLVALVSIQPVDVPLLPAIASAAMSPATESHVVSTSGSSAGAIEPVHRGEPALPAANLALSQLAVGLLLPAWLLGVVYCIARTVRQRISVEQLRSSTEIYAADEPLRILQDEARRLGVSRLPFLRFSSRIESPLLIGVRRPTIVLPAGAEEKFDAAELRLMIAHELAHVRRHDLAWNWLPTVAAWLFFFHPLVWVMRRCWSEAQEAACDEVLIQRRVAQPTDYGRLLLKLSACSPFESSAALGAAGVLGAYRNLERRILAMTRVKAVSTRSLATAAGAILLVALATIVPWRLVAAEPKPENETPSVAAEPKSEEEEEEEHRGTVGLITGTYTLNRSREPKAPLDPATLAALKRLKELGASVTPAGALSDTSVGIATGWQGTEADLDLIAQVADLKTLYFGLNDVSAEAVAKLVPKLKQPVDALVLEGLSDERLTALGTLPKCKMLMLGPQTLSAAGFRHLAAAAEGIESLQTQSPIDDTALAGIGQIKSLKDLWLFQAKITDAGLAHLAGLALLEKLTLHDCRGVRGAGYASLSPAGSLRTLTIAGPAIGAEATAALAKLTQLETLTLSHDRLPPAGLKAADVAALGNLKNLRRFQFVAGGKASDVARQATGSAILAAVSQIPALTDLSLAGVIVDADSLARLAKASSLEDLSLFQVIANDRSLEALGQLKNLKQLRLACSGFVIAAASTKLNGLTQFTRREQQNSGLDDADLAQLADLHALETLDLHGSKITGTGLKALVGLGQLKTLSLAGAPFTDEGAEALRGFPALESLNLSGGTKITDRALDVIATLPRLSVLNLDGTQVTADGLMKLRDLKHLSLITVAGVELSAEDMDRLRTAMPEVQIPTSDGAPSAAAYPEDSAAFANVATSLADRGRLDEAFALLEKAHEKEPSLAVYRVALQILRKNPVKATDAQKKMVEQWLSAALQESPDSLELKLFMADLQDMQGRFDDSIILFRELLARSDVKEQRRAVIQNNLAYYLVIRGRKDDLTEAQALIDDAVKQLGTIAGVLDTRGLIHLAQGDVESAVADFKVAVAHAPSAINYFHLALAEEKARNAAGAAEAFQKAVELKLDSKLLSPAEQRDYQRLNVEAAKRAKH